jgi:uncharacterized protein (DUF1810 family)
LVDSLYLFRDEFFETHSISEAEDKPRLLKQKLEECLEAMNKLCGQSESFIFTSLRNTIQVRLIYL